MESVYLMMAVGILVMLALALAFVLFVQRSRRKEIEDKLRLQKMELEHQQQLLFSTIMTQEEERQRIAKDLHDEVGSKLNVLLLNLHQLGKTREKPERHKEVQTDIKQLVDKTIDTTRRISHDLLPPVLEKFGLKSALEELCDNYRKTGHAKINFEICQDESRIADKVAELNLYRSVQELFTNSMKYADAQQISLQLWLGSQSAKLVFRDDGQGFDQENQDFQKGLGMQNIESRMKMISGTFDLQSKPSEGVTAILRYPYQS